MNPVNEIGQRYSLKVGAGSSPNSILRNLRGGTTIKTPGKSSTPPEVTPRRNGEIASHA